MRAIKRFVGDKVAFPVDGAVAEGTLVAVDRTGYIWVSDVFCNNTDLGDMILEMPVWVRRLPSE